MDTNKDLNINNYSLADTLALYNIPLGFTFTDYQAAKVRLDKITETYQLTDPPLTLFYQGCFKIIDCIYNYREDKRVSDREYMYDENEENIISFKIKKIKNFETKSSFDLLRKVVPEDKSPPAADPASFILPPTPETILPMNQLSRPLVTRVLTIDSRFRRDYDTTTSTDFSVQIPNTLSRVTQMRLLDFEMPTTFYVISSTNRNNYFWLKVTFNDVVEDTEVINYYYIQISDGNYTHSGLIAFINNQLDSLNITMSATSNIDGYDSGSGKTTFEPLDDTEFASQYRITSFNIYFHINYDEQYTLSAIVTETNFEKIYQQTNNNNLKSGVGWMMGYRQTQYIDENIYTSEGLFDAGGPKYLYLVVNDHNNNVHDSFFSAYDEHYLNKNILARISLSGALFTRVSDNYSITSVPRKYFGPVTINKLNIQLLNEFGTIMDLNNMDMSFSLEILTKYDN